MVGLRRAAGYLALVAVLATTAHAGPRAVSMATTARTHVAALTPAHNSYAAPSTIWWDADGALHAATQCGGYLALLTTATFPAVTAAVLRSLTGSTAPHSAQWHAAISRAAHTVVRGRHVGLVGRARAADIVPGDILAAAYTTDDVHGHTMVVGGARLDRAGVTSSIPGQPTVDRWRVEVYDSTSTPHGATDSRWRGDDGAHDQGIGRGEIYVFAATATGTIVGWTWSLTSTTVFQGTAPTDADYRPLVAGAFELAQAAAGGPAIGD